MEVVIPLELLLPLLEMSWSVDPDATTEALIEMIADASKRNKTITESVLRDLLGKLARGQPIR